MTNRLIAFVVFAMCTTGLFADEPKLTNPTRVFPTSQPAYKRTNQSHFFSMRLSPDGKRVLYTRPVAGSEKSDDRSARYELVLRELAGGKETVLPIDPLDRGYRTVLTRFNPFDPTGKRLILPNIKVETVKIDEHLSSSKMSVKWMIYDIAKAKVTSTEIKGGVGPAKFSADGQSLVTAGTDRRKLATKIISLKDTKAKPKLLKVFGYVQSICPVGDAAVIFVLPARPTSRPDGEGRRETPPIRLVLWDLKADKELLQFPTHSENRSLDDWETQWTADGRYLYYPDIEDAGTTPSGRPNHRSVTRVWDRQAGKLVYTLQDTVPVGHGPGRSLMVLARRGKDISGGFLLHDAAAGKVYPIGDTAKNLIHACGAKVIYAEKPDGSDVENVFSADLIVPKPQD